MTMQTTLAAVPINRVHWIPIRNMKNAYTEVAASEFINDVPERFRLFLYIIDIKLRPIAGKEAARIISLKFQKVHPLPACISLFVGSRYSALCCHIKLSVLRPI